MRFLAAINSTYQATNYSDASVHIARDNFPRHRSGVLSVQVHVCVNEMNQRIVTDLVDYLISVSAGTSIFTTPYQRDFIAKFADDINAVVSGGIVKHENAVVALIQYLR